jgi:hypothetical protein
MENLDNYKEAFHKTFKFNDENTYIITRYSAYMSAEIRKNKAQNILSLGIGHHIVSDCFSNELFHSVKEYVILEGSEAIIKNFVIISELKEKISVVHTFFEDYTTEKEFDVIEMGFVLEHVDDPFFIINKYKNYLSDKGSIFIAVPNARSLHRLIGYEAGLINNLYELSTSDLQLGHKRYFDLISLTNLVEKAGLKIKKQLGLLLKPVTTNQINQLCWDINIIDALLKIGDNYPDIANCILLEVSH